MILAGPEASVHYILLHVIVAVIQFSSVFSWAGSNSSSISFGYVVRMGVQKSTIFSMEGTVARTSRSKTSFTVFVISLSQSWCILAYSFRLMRNPCVGLVCDGVLDGCWRTASAIVITTSSWWDSIHLALITRAWMVPCNRASTDSSLLQLEGCPLLLHHRSQLGKTVVSNLVLNGCSCEDYC